MMVPLGSHYHVGIIVADMQAARDRLTESMSLTWGPVMHLDAVEYRDAQASDLTLPTTICYSVGDPCLELIEEVPGTVWVRNAHSNLHHVGFWSDDLVTESRSLTAVGCPLQLCGRAGSSAPASFAYHRDDELGIRIEVVDVSMRDDMAFLFRPEAAPS
jgi:catechol 2,3-dioxygenase-like lactoylglutathione lyase family enzyme